MFTKTSIMRLIGWGATPLYGHMNSLCFLRMQLGLSPVIVIPLSPWGISVLAGVSHGIHTSSLLLSLTSQLPETIQGIPEKTVKTLEGGSVPRDGGWYESFITHPHDNNFWNQIAAILRSLSPGEKYAILIQPQFSNGSHATLDGSFLTNSNPDMNKLREHFEPFIVKMEDDYNEEFCGETRIKIRNVTETGVPSPVPKSRTPSQTSQILQAMQTMQNTQLQAMQTQTNALLEAIKVSQPAPSPLGGINWQPIIQGALTGVAQSFGAQVSFPSPTTTQTTAASESVDKSSTFKAMQTQLESLTTSVSQQSKNLESLTTTVQQLSSTVAQQGNILNQLSQ